MLTLDTDIVVATQEGLTRHVTLNFDRDYLARLPEGRRNFLASLESALNAQGLTTVSSYEAHLPLPPTDHLNRRYTFIEVLSELFERPSDVDEMRVLALDEFERKKLLSSEQIETIGVEGVFRVKSRKYRDQHHVWKLHAILPEGRLNTKKKFEKTLCSSLEHLLIGIPNNFSKKNTSEDTLTVQWGCEILFLGFRQLLSSAIGLIEKNPAHDEKEVPNMVEKRRVEFLMKCLLANPSLNKSRFRGCLYDEELSKLVEPELVRIRTEHQCFCDANKEKLRKESFQKLTERYPGSSRSRLLNLIDAEIENHRHEIFKEHLRTDLLLNEICPGYGVLLANQLSAQKISSGIENKIANTWSIKKEEIRMQLSEANPILSLSNKWLEQRVSRQLKYCTNPDLVSKNDTYLKKLLESNLHLEHYLAELSLKFEKGEGKLYLAEISGKMKPVVVYFELYKWRSNHWTSISEYNLLSVDSDHIFWRWNVVAHRILHLMNNGLYCVLVLNLWNGTFGLRAMNIVSSTYKAGVVTYCSTYVGNMRGVVKQFNDALDIFRYAPDKGLIGKNVIRPFFVTSKLMLCAVRILVIAVGQPTLTACNIAISIFVALTAPLWATLISLLALLATMIISDFDNQTYSFEARRFPACSVPVQLFDMVLFGVGQIVLKVVQTVAYDVPMFVLKGIYSYVRFYARKVWDYLIMLVLPGMMHVPSMDSYFIKRIQGPCLFISNTDNFSFQVEAEVAISALQTALEKETLDVYVRNEKRKIKKPLKEFCDFFVNYFEPLHVDASSLPEAIRLKTEEEENLEVLDDATHDRHEELSKASLHDMQSKEQDMIRENPLFNGTELLAKCLANAQTKDMSNMAQITLTARNIRTTLSESERIVKMYYKDRIANYMDENETLAYWSDKLLVVDDFEGLMRYFYGTTFHPEFLTPFEANDGIKICIVKVLHPSLFVNISTFPDTRDYIPEQIGDQSV